MTESNFDPLKELTNLKDNVSRAIEKGFQTLTGANAIPVQLDVYELDGQIVIITSALDGVIPSSLEVTMEEDVLTIKGKTAPEETPRNASYLLHERRFGVFSRSLRLPTLVNANKAVAKLKGGKLTITLPIEDNKNRITITPVEE